MRTDSIISKLQRADAKSGSTYLPDLMIFIGEAEGDRFGLAAKLVTETWGFKTSKTALYEAYSAYLPFWRLEQARIAAKSTEELSTFDAEARRLTGQRTFEALISPDLHPKILLGFAKLQVDREKLEVDRRKLALLEEKMSSAQTKLQELRDPKKADDAQARQAILDRVDEIMGVKVK